MNDLDILVACINSLLIVVLFLMITRFWDYRIKMRLIKEGFIDEKSLAKLFEWNRAKAQFDLIKTGIFTGCAAGSILLLIVFDVELGSGLPLISSLLGSASIGAFISMYIASKKNG